ncbi:MAG TPA: metallophosphoesterase [Candidatus Lokiarchaeia archaeon]|nr:metallophosphoesterase [Candidatus Lokiarchaeia archaeon]
MELSLDNIAIDEQTAVLVFSDLHLGVDQTKFKAFLKIVNEICSNIDTKYTALKAIIFIGDLFDLMVSDYDNLGSKDNYTPAYEDLFKIKDRVTMIYALGNHEAPIPEAKFSKQKKGIYKGLSKVLNGSNFIDEANVCQYIFMKSTHGSNATFELYDTKKQMKEPGKNIDLGISFDDTSSDLGKKTLLVHGHQLLEAETEACGIIWYFLWKSPENVKKIVRKVWNRAGNVNYEHDKAIIAQEIEAIKDPDLRVKVRENLDNLLLYEKHDKNPTNLDDLVINDELKTFFKKQELLSKHDQFKDVSTVIFGHTHKCKDRYDLQVKQNDLHVYNSGAWLAVNTPSFIGINASGHVQLYVIS